MSCCITSNIFKKLSMHIEKSKGTSKHPACLTGMSWTTAFQKYPAIDVNKVTWWLLSGGCWLFPALPLLHDLGDLISLQYTSAGQCVIWGQPYSKVFLSFLTFVEDRYNRQAGYDSAVVLQLLISGGCMDEARYSSSLPPFPVVNKQCMVSGGVWPLASSWGQQSGLCCHGGLLKGYQSFSRNLWQGRTFFSPFCCLPHCLSLTTGHNVFFLTSRWSVRS